jgi:hypothetical protein
MRRPSSMSSHDNILAGPQQPLVNNIIEQFQIGLNDVRKITQNFLQQMSRLVSMGI